MKKIISIVIIVFCGIIVSAQTKSDSLLLNKPDTSATFRSVKTMPRFPGGLKALQTYLIYNTNYPPEAKKNGITGKVYVGFIVEKNGTVTNVFVEKSSGSEVLDNEAVRVISKMPKWKAGKMNGKKVRVLVTQPINFKLK